MYIKIMELSEYIIAPDGNLYWGEHLNGILFPITSVGEISCFGFTMELENNPAVFIVNDSIVKHLCLN